MNLRGGEGAADISARAIREARDEEDITNSVHTSKAYTHIQTIPLHLAVHYKSILIFSSPSKPNFSTFPNRELGCTKIPWGCHYGDPTKSSAVQM